MLFEHDPTLEEAVQFSRFDEDHLLSTASRHSFQLEDRVWPTAEHYYQAHKFEGKVYAQSIIIAKTGKEAYSLGNRWLKSKVTDWKRMRRLWMTRALYRKAREYPEVKDALLATGDNLIIETSLYDHFWGIGRDQRGKNILGKVWMDIRKRL
ncbi:MAG: ribA/ribD-fused uncharacterized protein [Cellvibrionaceae bacterium]